MSPMTTTLISPTWIARLLIRSPIVSVALAGFIDGSPLFVAFVHGCFDPRFVVSAIPFRSVPNHSQDTSPVRVVIVGLSRPRPTRSDHAQHHPAHPVPILSLLSASLLHCSPGLTASLLTRAPGPPPAMPFHGVIVGRTGQ